MFKLVSVLLVVRSALTSDSQDILEALNLIPPIARNDPDPEFLKDSTFPRLMPYYLNSPPASTFDYPWIAQVLHARFNLTPHVCTATCIEEGIYVTSARCIATLKVKQTTIYHMEAQLKAKAFVMPSKPTKQMFDDIGFIVVNTTKWTKYVIKWESIKPFYKVNRTDEMFEWSKKMDTYLLFKGRHILMQHYRVIGYGLNVREFRIDVESQFDLRHLNVTVEHDICMNMLEQFRKKDGFKVPCYYPCTFQQYLRGKCDESYLGVEGAALIDYDRKYLVGVATWGVYYKMFERLMPVGFSVVNSKDFYEDLSCARRLQKSDPIYQGYFQSLCDGKK